MTEHILIIQIRWADIDQNRHLRHSAYYDYAAMARMKILTENGLGIQKMEALHIGPILFREEAIFYREIVLDDELIINTKLASVSSDYSRWSIQHVFTKNKTTKAAVINVEGAWMDIEKRKLAFPESHIINTFNALSKKDDFVVHPIKEK